MENQEIQNRLKEAGLTHATDGLLMTATGRHDTPISVIREHLKNSRIRRKNELTALVTLESDLASIEDDWGEFLEETIT